MIFYAQLNICVRGKCVKTSSEEEEEEEAKLKKAAAAVVERA